MERGVANNAAVEREKFTLFTVRFRRGELLLLVDCAHRKGAVSRPLVIGLIDFN